jgi:hypothetical protein
LIHNMMGYKQQEIGVLGAKELNSKKIYQDF